MAPKAHVNIDMIDDVRREIEDDLYRIGADDDVVVDDETPIGGETVDDDVVDEDIDPADKLPKNATKNADGSVTVKLGFPQKVRHKSTHNDKIRDSVFSELVMHRLTGADQRAIGAASDDMMSVVAFARSTRMSQAVMNALYDKLDMADINAMGQVLNHFLGSGQKTGR